MKNFENKITSQKTQLQIRQTGKGTVWGSTIGLATHRWLDEIAVNQDVQEEWQIEQQRFDPLTLALSILIAFYLICLLFI